MAKANDISPYRWWFKSQAWVSRVYQKLRQRTPGKSEIIPGYESQPNKNKHSIEIEV